MRYLAQQEEKSHYNRRLRISAGGGGQCFTDLAVTLHPDEDDRNIGRDEACFAG
jgi:hypothetical protein